MKIIAGNWKLHKGSREAERFVLELAKKAFKPGRRVLIAPAFTAIASAAKAAVGSAIEIGAQNMSAHREGAFTGEVSAAMVKEAGARFVLLGHSERRHVFHESDDTIREKLKSALQEELTPILCIGEKLEERESDQWKARLEQQLQSAFTGVPLEALKKVIIAYEPVWAIGTGRAATPEIAGATHCWIRHWLETHAVGTLPLLYGGSVRPDSMQALMAQQEIDGVLVGAASLDVESFAAIINY